MHTNKEGFNVSDFTLQDFEVIVEDLKKIQPLQEYDFGFYANSPIYIAYLEWIEIQKTTQ